MSIIFYWNVMTFSRKAFTLVELVVIIWVISILWIIAAVQYSSNLSIVRDATRINQMTEIHNGLTAVSIQKRVPMPAQKVDILANSRVIWYQGDVDENLVKVINFTSSALDPKTSQPYTVLMNKKRNKFQILWYLENESSSQISLVSNTQAQYGYDFPYSSWDKLGIIMDQNNRVIHKVESISTSWSFDVESQNMDVVVQYNDEKTYQGNISELDFYTTAITTGWVQYASCKEIYENMSAAERKNGEYLIILWDNQDVIVECNMTDNGWGWTRYAEIKTEFNFSLAEECYNSQWIVETTGFYCFNPHRQMVDADDLMVQLNQDYASDLSGTQYVMDVSSNHVWLDPMAKDGDYRECSPKNRYMTPMSRWDEHYSGNAGYYRIWLTFCWNSRQPGWVSSVSSVMNFSNSSKWPVAWNGINANRYSTVVPFTFYFR